MVTYVTMGAEGPEFHFYFCREPFLILSRELDFFTWAPHGQTFSACKPNIKLFRLLGSPSLDENRP